MFIGKVKEQVKKIRSEMRKKPYHEDHRRQALQILKNVEPEKGRLSQHLIKKCDQYAEDVLGSKVYAPWLYVYTIFANEFKEGWIPDDFYGEVVVPKLKGGYGKIASLKPLNSLVFSSNSFPDAMSFVNGIFFDSDYTPIKKEEIPDRLFVNSNKVIYKLDNSLQGRGIHFFEKGSFNVDEIPRLGNGLFQNYISQHDSLAAFSDSSVSTLRITTTSSDEGDISIRASYLRLGGEGDAYVKSSTHIRVPVNSTNGLLNNVGYTAQWREIKKHPLSNKKFEGFYYPKFLEACLLVKKLHKKVPYVRCIGWDIAVNQEGTPMVMEWNGQHNDIKFSEATQGPCFADLGWERLRKK